LRWLAHAALLWLATGLGGAVAQQRAPDPAPDCRSPAPTVETAYCLEQELKAADTELNAAFQAAIARIKAQSHLTTSQRRDWDRALREAQRHWIAFVAKDCGEVTGWEWYRGTGQSSATLACRLARTKTRTVELIERYKAR
jgi:uncharacterized protein YecT (DUF1311 family)